MVLELQILGFVFTLVMLYLTYLYFRRDSYGVRSFAIWACVWIGGGLLLLFPQWFRGVAQGLSFARVTDFYFTLAIMFFGLVTFFNFVQVKKQSVRMENFVRKLAIEQGKKKK
jgi:hypothetical protein